MAKKEKSSSTTKKKPATKSASKSSSTGAPPINTALAASAAAALVGNKVPLNSPSTGAPRKESASFKHLKESLNKPASGGLTSFLDSSSIQKKTNTPFTPGAKQVGQNQTYGADVTRTGVPRRTAG
jgi:hypothetical protein